jgi:hypothetical protein
MLMRRDDTLEIEVRITLETDDKQQIYMSWKGFRHGPKEVIDRLNRGESVEYGWMNRICSIATGSRKGSGRTFDVFQML